MTGQTAEGGLVDLTTVARYQSLDPKVFDSYLVALGKPVGYELFIWGIAKNSVSSVGDLHFIRSNVF